MYLPMRELAEQEELGIDDWLAIDHAYQTLRREDSQAAKALEATANAWLRESDATIRLLQEHPEQFVGNFPKVFSREQFYEPGQTVQHMGVSGPGGFSENQRLTREQTRYLDKKQDSMDRKFAGVDPNSAEYRRGLGRLEGKVFYGSRDRPSYHRGASPERTRSASPGRT